MITMVSITQSRALSNDNKKIKIRKDIVSLTIITNIKNKINPKMENKIS